MNSTQKMIDRFNKEKHELINKHCDTNKKVVKHIDKTWSLDLLDLVDYGTNNKRGYAFILVVTDNFSCFELTNALKNNNAQIKN